MEARQSRRLIKSIRCVASRGMFPPPHVAWVCLPSALRLNASMYTQRPTHSMTPKDEEASTVENDEDDEDDGEEEDEEKTADWGALSSQRFRHASEEGLGEEERARYRMLNATTWLSGKMKVRGWMNEEAIKGMECVCVSYTRTKARIRD